MDIRGVRVAVALAPVALLMACAGAVPPKGSSHPVTSTSSPPTTVTLAAPTTTSAPTSTVPATLTTSLPFSAESVTFVSTQVGWVLGTGSCRAEPAPSCAPALLRTDDAGRTWTQVPAPEDGHIAEVRFANEENGWLFGVPWDSPPDLWATHDGGMNWVRVQIPGIALNDSISDLEAAAGVVSATFNASPNALIATSTVGIDNWSLSPTTVAEGGGPVPGAQIVLHGTIGWMVQVDRTVTGGARLDRGAWVPWTPPCSQSGGEAFLSASDSAHVVALCDAGVWGNGPPHIDAYLSANGGSTFELVHTELNPTSFGRIASPSPGVVVMGDDYGGALLATFDNGAKWQTVYQPPGQPTWQQIGFTTSSQGVAIDNAGTMLMTFDGGRVWTPVVFPSVELPAAGTLPAVATLNPTVGVTPSGSLINGEQVKILVTGFGHGGKVHFSECATLADATDLGSGTQLTAQSIGITDSAGYGSYPFALSTTAATKPYDDIDRQPCTDQCVLVATRGAGSGFVDFPLSFGGS